MNPENYHKIFEEKKCCVVLPTYNNAPFLLDVINDISKYTNHIIVVNDGSTDNSSEIIAQIDSLYSISYEHNKGKGYAIKKGLRFAESLGFDYAITMDSDGQHYADDLPLFLEKIDASQKQIVIGIRNTGIEGQKKSSGFANKFSNFWFLIETGIKHPDTQSGFRLYPLKIVNRRKYFTNRYEFEIEILVRNAWHGIDIAKVPVKVRYLEGESRISHFRPFKDFFRISILNTVLVIVAFFYGLPARLYHIIRKKGIREIIKDNILRSKDSNLKISKAVGLGFFMGILPVWGWQTIAAIALSHYFKLNKAIVILAANISIPPMMPLILFLSFYTGALVLGNDLDLVHFVSNLNLETVTNDLYQYIIGSLVLAVVAGFSTFALTFVLLKIFRKKNHRKI